MKRIYFVQSSTDEYAAANGITFVEEGITCNGEIVRTVPITRS